ncbi:unnamed protein product [Pylaiella littoralis]
MNAALFVAVSVAGNIRGQEVAPGRVLPKYSTMSFSLLSLGHYCCYFLKPNYSRSAPDSVRLPPYPASAAGKAQMWDLTPNFIIEATTVFRISCTSTSLNDMLAGLF